MFNIKQIQNIIEQIAEERDLNEKDIREIIISALSAAYKKDYRHKEEKVEGKMDPTGKRMDFYLVKTVVDDNDVKNQNIKFNPYRYILLSEAAKIKPNAKVGEEIYIPLEYKEEFSRVAAQTAKQVIMQKLKEITKNTAYEEFKTKEGKIITGIIQRVNNRGIYVDLSKAVGTMFRTETIPGEYYRIGDRKKFYVYAVEKTFQGVEVYLSRAHPLFVPALFSFEIPEVGEGIIEIKGIVRIPGVRSKMSVKSNIEGIDAVGSCIGPKGARVLSISNELNGEKIDIIQYSDDPLQYVLNAISPGKAINAELLPKRTIKIYVTEDQLPIVLGKNGQNIQLAAKLVGWRIDVRLVEEPEKEIKGGIAEVEEVNEDKNSSLEEGEAQDVA